MIVILEKTIKYRFPGDFAKHKTISHSYKFWQSAAVLLVVGRKFGMRTITRMALVRVLFQLATMKF